MLTNLLKKIKDVRKISSSYGFLNVWRRMNGLVFFFPEEPRRIKAANEIKLCFLYIWDAYETREFYNWNKSWFDCLKIRLEQIKERKKVNGL